MNYVSTKLTNPKASVHAKKRIRERFNVLPDKEEKWLRKWAPKFEYITQTYSHNEELCRMFSFRDWVIVADLNEDYIVTTYQIDKGSHEAEVELREFARQQLAKSQRQQNRQLREINVTRTKIERELCVRETELRRARSLPKKIAIQARINALLERLDELPGERSQAQKQHIVRARGYARVI